MAIITLTRFEECIVIPENRPEHIPQLVFRAALVKKERVKYKSPGSYRVQDLGLLINVFEKNPGDFTAWVFEGEIRAVVVNDLMPTMIVGTQSKEGFAVKAVIARVKKKD